MLTRLPFASGKWPRARVGFTYTYALQNTKAYRYRFLGASAGICGYLRASAAARARGHLRAGICSSCGHLRAGICGHLQAPQACPASRIAAHGPAEFCLLGGGHSKNPEAVPKTVATRPGQMPIWPQGLGAWTRGRGICSARGPAPALPAAAPEPRAHLRAGPLRMPPGLGPANLIYIY